MSDLEFVKALITEAKSTALAKFRSVRPQEKANQSYVTDLDKELEAFIRDRLAERFPDDALSGEEYEAGGGKGPRLWSIDPIDGTGNMVHGLPLWAISIGLIDAGEPALGVIAVPPLDELYWATKGGGAWKDGARLAVQDAETFHDQDNVSVGTNALRRLDSRTIPGRLRDLGSACCELTFLASRRLQACVFLGEHLHDVAAGALIAAEAGCSFGSQSRPRMTAAEFLAATPVVEPAFIAPPKRLDVLLSQAHALPPIFDRERRR